MNDLAFLQPISAVLNGLEQRQPMAYDRNSI